MRVLEIYFLWYPVMAELLIVMARCLYKRMHYNVAWKLDEIIEEKVEISGWKIYVFDILI